MLVSFHQSTALGLNISQKKRIFFVLRVDNSHSSHLNCAPWWKPATTESVSTRLNQSGNMKWNDYKWFALHFTRVFSGAHVGVGYRLSDSFFPQMFDTHVVAVFWIRSIANVSNSCFETRSSAKHAGTWLSWRRTQTDGGKKHQLSAEFF